MALPEDLRGYADYMAVEVFARAASQLINLAGQATVLLLCAEKLPEHCHRALIADYLVLQGVQVMHLIAPDRLRQAGSVLSEFDNNRQE